MTKTLYRTTTNRVIAGVCGGIADYFDIDPVIVRVIFVAAALVTEGFAVLIYIVMWAFVPESPDSTGDTISNNHIAMDTRLDDTKEMKSSKKEGVKHEAEPSERRRADRRDLNDRSNVTGGLILVAIGLIFLANNFWPGMDWGKLWPVVLLAVGLALLWNASRNRDL